MPAFGTPTGYDVIIYSVTQNSRALVATIATKTTSVRIPPTILQDGKQYVFIVRAVAAPNDDIFSRNWNHLPHALTSAMTAEIGVGHVSDLYVDAKSGSDQNLGLSYAPFKTITHALSIAQSGDTIHVQPGTYNAANGETFPLKVPAGVTLTSVNAHGATITGSGPNSAGIAATLVLADGATLTGFRLPNADPGSELIDVAGSDQVAGNLLIGGTTPNKQYGLTVNGGQNMITGNEIHGMTVGIDLNTTTTTRLEDNIITQNQTGVLIDDTGDLGGGQAMSMGGNVLSCNTVHDLTVAVGGETIEAQKNAWDHAPPSVGTATTDDIYNTTSSGSTVVTTGAKVAPSACP